MKDQTCYDFHARPISADQAKMLPRQLALNTISNGWALATVWTDYTGTDESPAAVMAWIEGEEEPKPPQVFCTAYIDGTYEIARWYWVTEPQARWGHEAVVAWVRASIKGDRFPTQESEFVDAPPGWHWMENPDPDDPE